MWLEQSSKNYPRLLYVAFIDLINHSWISKKRIIHEWVESLCSSIPHEWVKRWGSIVHQLCRRHSSWTIIKKLPQTMSWKNRAFLSMQSMCVHEHAFYMCSWTCILHVLMNMHFTCVHKHVFTNMCLYLLMNPWFIAAYEWSSKFCQRLWKTIHEQVKRNHSWSHWKLMFNFVHERG